MDNKIWYILRWSSNISMSWHIMLNHINPNNIWYCLWLTLEFLQSILSYIILIYSRNRRDYGCGWIYFMDNRQIVCQNMIWNKKARTYLRTGIFHCLHTKVNSSCWKPRAFTCCYRSYEFIWISDSTRKSHTIHHLMQIIKISN